MIVDVTRENLPFFEALASGTRLDIIRLLATGDLNIKELAQRLHVSDAIVTKHIKKLEKAGIVKARRVCRNGSAQKVCMILNYEFKLKMPDKVLQGREYHHVNIPVGLYSDFDVQPTCGLAEEKEQIGIYDDPRSFLDARRAQADIVWFSQGFVEYKFANFLLPGQIPTEIELSFEISSEAPGFSENWPSDISVLLNGMKICQWTCPGEFGSHRGVLTPSWWDVGQYGMLKTVLINDKGIYLDDEKQSDRAISAVPLPPKCWTLRFEVPADAQNIGGITLFGKGFGDYQQDIVVRTYYRTVKEEESAVRSFHGRR